MPSPRLQCHRWWVLTTGSLLELLLLLLHGNHLVIAWPRAISLSLTPTLKQLTGAPQPLEMGSSTAFSLRVSFRSSAGVSTLLSMTPCVHCLAVESFLMPGKLQRSPSWHEAGNQWQCIAESGAVAIMKYHGYQPPSTIYASPSASFHCLINWSLLISRAWEDMDWI